MVAQLFHAADKGLVEGERSLAAPQDDHRAALAVGGRLSSQRGDRSADRVTRHQVCGRSGKSPRGVRKPQAGEVRPATEPRRRPARHGVLLQEHERHSGQSGRPHDGNAGKASQSDDEGCSARRQKFASRLGALPEPIRESHRPRQQRRRRLDRQGDMLEAVAGDNLSLNVAGRADKHAFDRPSAGEQDLRDGDSGKEMSPRAASGEDNRFRRSRRVLCRCVLRIAHAGRSGCRIAQGAAGLASAGGATDGSAAASAVSVTGGRIQISP